MTDFSNFDWYKGDLLWLPKRTIFLTKHGSHAYGTNLPTSDLDIKGIAIAPKECYLGYLNSFEQAETREPIDAVIYDVRKFVKLASDCNPNLIEVLFVDERDWILPYNSTGHPYSELDHADDFWFPLWENRDLFLSKKAKHTFSGYAHAQLKRIRTHRKWLLNPPTHKPTRSEFGLSDAEGTLGKEQLGVVEAKIRKVEDAMGGKGMTKDQVELYDEQLVTTAVGALNLDINLIPVVIAERKYGAAARNWESYQNWKSERNATRAELEAKHGYDTKHAMHLVRLMRMAKEILSGQGVIVRRPDAEELLSIRNGAWDFDQLMAWADGLDAELEDLYKTSTLPHEADRKSIDRLLVNLLSKAL